MNLTKKTKISIGIAAGLVLTTALGLWYSYSNKLLFWKEEPYVPNPDAEKASNDRAAALGKPKITWRNDSFPLSLGSKGQNVKNLQKFLGIEDDGYFGYDTQAAVKARFNTDKVASESVYAGTSTTTEPAPSAFTKGQKVYARGNKAKIYSRPQSSGYLGYIPSYTYIGIYEATSSEPGWSKVNTTGYYRTEPGIFSDSDKFYEKRGTYFVPTAQITGTPA